MTLSYANSSLCLSILRRKSVNARHAITLTDSAEDYLRQIKHDNDNSGNIVLYLIEIISVNLVKQYKDCPFSN